MKTLLLVSALTLVPLVLSGCSPWLKAMEDLRAINGGSRPYATLEGTKWQWQSGVLDGGPVTVQRPDLYTVAFMADHRVTVRADCNRGRGAWTAKLETITVGPVGYTKQSCAVGSLGSDFARALESSTTWFIREGALFLELPQKRGTIRLTLVDASTA